MPACMFCDAPKTSKEHVVGKWLKQFAGDHDVGVRFQHVVSREDIPPRPGMLQRDGTPLSQTSRVVCKACNNGWMSGIEERMKAVFPRLNDWALHSLTCDDWDAIETWMTLKWHIVARMQYDAPLPPDRAFQLDQIIKDRKRFFIPPHVPDQSVCLMRCDRADIWAARNYLSNFGEDRRDGQVHHLQAGWIGLGRVILFSVSRTYQSELGARFLEAAAERLGAPIYGRLSEKDRFPCLQVSHRFADDLLEPFARPVEGFRRLRMPVDTRQAFF